MDGFIKCLTKFAVIFSIGLAVLLLVVADVLIFAPELLLKIIYYGLILDCLIGAVLIIVLLFRCFIRSPKKQ